MDDGRRGKGYVFGAFQAASSEAFTDCYDHRTTVNFVDFLAQVDAWLPAEAETISAMMDNLAAHHSADVLLFSARHPRWRFVFQPTYASYLNLIEPWWKTLRSLALKGRRFETWEEVEQAIREATRYLECPSPSVRPGAATAATTASPAGHRADRQCRIDWPDAPLRRFPQGVRDRCECLL